MTILVAGGITLACNAWYLPVGGYHGDQTLQLWEYSTCMGTSMAVYTSHTPTQIPEESGENAT